jgi:hypothetical protein
LPGGRVADPVRRRAALVATAVALPVAVILALLFNRSALRSTAQPSSSGTGSASATATPLTPVPVPVPPRSGAADRTCPALVAALPARLGDLPARPVAPASPLVRAWGEPPVALRCGVPRPAGFVVGASNVFAVNGPRQRGAVTWFVAERPDRAVWTVVDRTVYIEVTVPRGYASAPIPALSDVVAGTLPGVPARPGR